MWLVAVALIALWPTPVDRGGGGWLRQALPAPVTYDSVEFISNVVMFAPFGLFWFLLAPKGWRWAGPLVGLGLSLAIEVAQAVLLPQRVATPYDVLANTLGAVVGALVAWVVVSVYHRGRTP